MSEFVLEMKNIDKSFFKVKVLDNVSFNLKPGEVHALVGENGAGKSTLMKILMGIYHRNAGEIILDGRPVTFQTPREALDNGIAMIPQELSPILDIGAAEYIFIGREIRKNNLGGLSIVDKKAQIQETDKLFKSAGIEINPKCLMRNLSVAQIQLVEIIKAISLSSKIIIMDEPTSAITYKEIETLFEQIKKLKTNGVAVVYISHKMEEISQIADRITVLRDGKQVCTDYARNLNKEKTIKLMVGREIKDIYPKQKTSIGKVILEVRNLSLKNKFHNISFNLHTGEILGIAGLVGAGRSELVECIFGVTKPETGEVLVKGEQVKIVHPKDAIRNRIALITEDRNLTGLNLKSTVEHNISIVQLAKLSKFGVINKKNEADAVEAHINKLNIRTLSRKSMVHSLSGGNQQKVVLAKWLLTDPDIIILDEPTRGIDVGAKRDIYLLIGKLAKIGKAVLIISSEIPEIMGLSDRIIVLADGRLTGKLSRDQFTQEDIMRFASKIEVVND
ncbi:MAG: sugar ABC transporter ATP-binding protein [Anaerolineaceae bacterium]|nr:sugar ABC transporter ATP-binding protein [Anaerolineaceae bacterium]